MRKTLMALGLTTSGVLLASACGSGGGTTAAPAPPAANPQQVVAAAYTTTMNAKTAKLNLVVDATAAGKTIHSTGSGVMQFDPMKLDLTTQAGGQSTEVRTLDGTTYVRSAADGKWSKLDTGKLTGGMNQASPDQILSYLQGASSQVTSTGPATINGQQATGYQATIDLDKVAAKQASAQAKQLIQLAEQLTGTKTLPVQVWVDGQGRLVREVNNIDVTAVGQQVQSKTTLDLTDYGTPVDITAPPASELNP
jgi:hypothetical protein